MKKLAGYMTSLEVKINIFQFGVGFKDFLRLFHFKRRVNNRPSACDGQNNLLNGQVTSMVHVHLWSVATGYSAVTLW